MVKIAEDPQMITNRLTADSGYESDKNYIYLESKGIDYYIEPQTYEQQKKTSKLRSVIETARKRGNSLLDIFFSCSH